MTTIERILITAPNAAFSAESIAGNVDLLTQILIFLPIKSLLKFKSVSKHWLSLISDPNFYCKSCGNPRSRWDTYCRIKIYSSATGGLWRPVGNRFSVLEVDKLMFDSRVFWNGAVYWISRSETSLRFDIEEELLRETPMPLIPGGWEPSTVRYFGESHGHLNMINFYLPRRIEFDVYEIESDCSGWFMKYRVDLFGVLGAFPEMIRSYLDPLDMDYYGF
ncbi:F-box domain containing protein [Trema orientale]|uniref:F-box domain containing protein n=1 Tax=Trema orientale TaxID=63057 RepID=A0A2P5F3Q5_TREOI|nr:F-box domain containing protein [Trema orientale]